jgi:predicted anti-sigma-YlaC factor YlaD
MNHLTEEQIVLQFYGDADGEQDIRQHLDQCATCRQEFARVSSLLTQITPEQVPEPPATFEEKTWLNVRDRLPQRAGGWGRLFSAPPKWALAGVMALLIAAAFLAGRFWPRHQDQILGQLPVANPQRLVLVAVGGHLERSQMLLMEIMNTDSKAPVDLSSEQQQARDLLDDNHLYRVSAQRAGDSQIAALLDDLGRVLAEVANGPSELSPSDLRQIHDQIQSDGLLFKVRVVGSEVNSRVRRQEQSSTGSVNQRL